MAIAEYSGRVRPTRDNVRDFVAWVASAPRSMVDTVRAAIAEDYGEDVVDALGELLLTEPEIDLAHATTTLSILGEARHPAAIRYLREFVWDTSDIDDPIADANPPLLTDGKFIGCDMDLKRKAVLQARAAEMLCYLRLDQVFDYTLQIVVEHPEPQVRHAAIDAYLYNNGDSAEVRDELMRTVREEDRPWVGLPRRTADMDAATFDATLAELHAQDPPPPLPDKETHQRSKRDV
ncbi:hypothetical protein [Nocardia altamirensis]|uniref:hypothetical protein n=1 Tax=Nocardia altamirensis TaxID=472158 RepID=UPI0008402C49|nr:hypothetical protein [Nocardia altamirensis]